jgi:hypothetical protein
MGMDIDMYTDTDRCMDKDKDVVMDNFQRRSKKLRALKAIRHYKLKKEAFFS